MEYVLLTAAAGAVFLCLFCAWFGYRLGLKNRETRTVQRVVEGGKVVTETTTETMERAAQAAEAEPADGEQAIEQQFENIRRYEPQFPGVKNG